MSKYSVRCPKCNQFASEYHRCPVDEGYVTAATGVKWTENKDGALLEFKTRRIRTLSDLLEAAEVDITKWYVERHVINKWEVGVKNADGDIDIEPLFQVKVWLKPLMPIADVTEIIREQVDDMKLFSPDPKVIYGSPIETGMILY